MEDLVLSRGLEHHKGKFTALGQHQGENGRSRQGSFMNLARPKSSVP